MIKILIPHAVAGHKMILVNSALHTSLDYLLLLSYLQCTFALNRLQTN